MRWSLSCAAVFAAACGRLHFDARDDAAIDLDAASDTMFDALEADLVPVPAATFFMGCNTSIDANCETDEDPGRMVTLTRSVAIERTEVTEAAYQECIDAGACTLPTMDFDPIGRAQHPVNYVTWLQTVAYCTWRGRRLPTEAEWELAARGTDGRIYPWGNQAFSCTLANAMNCVGDTTPVGSYPGGASPYGALDMGGNLWEYVADYYDVAYYGVAPSTDPPGPPSVNGARTNRGGYYANAPSNVRASSRSFSFDTATLYVGFRCAVSL